MNKQSSNADGSELVFRTVLDHWYAKHKSYYGAMQWFASELGVTRQRVDAMRKQKAFPNGHISAVCKLFPKLKPSDIRPEDHLKSKGKS